MADARKGIIGNCGAFLFLSWRPVRSLGLAFSDYDGDGFADIFVANDAMTTDTIGWLEQAAHKHARRLIELCFLE
jgi:hypothetical protein